MDPHFYELFQSNQYIGYSLILLTFVFINQIALINIFMYLFLIITIYELHWKWRTS